MHERSFVPDTAKPRSRALPPSSFVDQHQPRRGRHREGNSLALAWIQVLERAIDLRDAASLQSLGFSREKSRDWLRCTSGLKLFPYLFRDQNPFEQFRQDVLKVDKNEVVQRRRIANDDH